MKFSKVHERVASRGFVFSTMMRRASVVGAALLGTALLLVSQTIQPPELPQEALNKDPLLRAMHDEMARANQLAEASDADAPYFISYTISTAMNFSVAAQLGAILEVTENEFRSPEIEVRVGDYDFDNTGHVYSGAYNGSRFDGTWPLDDNYENLRDSLWLGTDRAYKAALQSIARKRASQNNAAASLEVLPDFAPAAPVVSLPEVKRQQFDQQEWVERARRASAVFRNYEDVLTSVVNGLIVDGDTHTMNSEGTAVHYEDSLAWIRGKGEGQAPDGMLVHDAATLQTLKVADFYSESETVAKFNEVAGNVHALTNAPKGEPFVGPTLFEPSAAAQLFAQLLGDNLGNPRRPLTEPGRSVNFIASEFETRMGARVLPDFFHVYDDPTLKEWNGRPLAGYYKFDLEGVPAQRVDVIEEGRLRDFLTTRQPTKEDKPSNGHARLPGSYGSQTAAIGNLFIEAVETQPMDSLKQELLRMIDQRGVPYGMLVRKLDFPYSGSTSELQALARANSQTGGGALPISPPVLIYRVYPDGREELVRGLRFRGVNTRSLRDILAASEETAVFDYVNTTTPLALLGSGGYLAATSVISPGLLFDELEFDIPQEQLPKPPTVPPPSAE